MDSQSVVHIRRGGHWRGLGFGDVWEYRGLLGSLGLRDVKLRYRQTLLGALWVLLQPLLAAGIMTVVFGLIAAVPGPEGVPYFAFAYVGQVAWSLFSLTVTRTAGSMLGSQALLTKIYFPRPILPLATISGVLLDFAMSCLMAIPIIYLYAQGPINIPLAAISGFVLLMLATGIGMVLAALSVWFRDVLFMLPILVQLAMYASPVAYGIDAAHTSLSRYPSWYFTAYMLNPLASPLEAFRWALLGRGEFLPGFFIYSTVCAIVVFGAGFALFRSAEGKFADVV
jgi:lipopolysaccharide transport system permease protein